MKLLATADIHIGRRPSHIPEDAARDFSAAAVWDNVVAVAVREAVDALLLAGDIVDETNKYFEAVGALQAGLERLAEHGIAVFAVGGNHDFDVLPRLCTQIGSDNFRMLGAGGRWECAVAEAAQGAAVQLFGWSFPDRIVRSSPLPMFPADLVDPGLPAIGVLHCDLDSSSSAYCPVRRREFDPTGVPVWLLGHIHKASVAGSVNDPGAVYLGSPQGMDPGPGETGLHGPWLIDFERGQARLRQVPCAFVRYDECSVPLDTLDAETDVQRCLSDAVMRAARTVCEQEPSLRLLSLRLRLAGVRAVAREEIEAQCRQFMESGIVVDGMPTHANDCSLDLRPAADLEALGQGAGLVGELARLLLSLSDSGDLPAAYTDLAVEADRVVATVCRSGTFALLQQAAAEHVPAPESGRALLVSQAWRLLDELLCQGGAHD